VFWWIRNFNVPSSPLANSWQRTLSHFVTMRFRADALQSAFVSTLFELLNLTNSTPSREKKKKQVYGEPGEALLNNGLRVQASVLNISQRLHKTFEDS
jgi:hypothetical protein